MKQATRRMSTEITTAVLLPMTTPVLIESAAGGTIVGVPAVEQNMEYCSHRIHRSDM